MRVGEQKFGLFSSLWARILRTHLALLGSPFFVPSIRLLLRFFAHYSPSVMLRAHAIPLAIKARFKPFSVAGRVPSIFRQAATPPQPTVCYRRCAQNALLFFSRAVLKRLYFRSFFFEHDFVSIFFL